MYKNNLKDLMSERNISSHKLASETSISRQTISKIKNNGFHNISINVLTELLVYFNLSFNDFGTIYTREEYLQMLLFQKSFNYENLSFLEFLLSKNLNVSFNYQPYSSKQCLNLYSKGYFKKFSFSGNIRINTSLHGLTFEIIDFDLYRINKNFCFNDFYIFYKKFIIQLENYALALGFTQIVININSYFDKNLKITSTPRKVNLRDLELLVNNYNFSNRENELIKTSIIKELGYIDYTYKSNHKKKLYNIYEVEKINNYVDSLNHLSFFQKEQKRISIFSKKHIYFNHNTQKFIKLLNPEVTS